MDFEMAASTAPSGAGAASPAHQAVLASRAAMPCFQELLGLLAAEHEREVAVARAEAARLRIQLEMMSSTPRSACALPGSPPSRPPPPPPPTEDQAGDAGAGKNRKLSGDPWAGGGDPWAQAGDAGSGNDHKASGGPWGAGVEHWDPIATSSRRHQPVAAGSSCTTEGHSYTTEQLLQARVRLETEGDTRSNTSAPGGDPWADGGDPWSQAQAASSEPNKTPAARPPGLSDPDLSQLGTGLKAIRIVEGDSEPSGHDAAGGQESGNAEWHKEGWQKDSWHKEKPHRGSRSISRTASRRYPTGNEQAWEHQRARSQRAPPSSASGGRGPKGGDDDDVDDAEFCRLHVVSREQYIRKHIRGKLQHFVRELSLPNEWLHKLGLMPFRNQTSLLLRWGYTVPDHLQLDRWDHRSDDSKMDKEQAWWWASPKKEDNAWEEPEGKEAAAEDQEAGSATHDKSEAQGSHGADAPEGRPAEETGSPAEQQDLAAHPGRDSGPSAAQAVAQAGGTEAGAPRAGAQRRARAASRQAKGKGAAAEARRAEEKRRAEEEKKAEEEARRRTLEERKKVQQELKRKADEEVRKAEEKRKAEAENKKAAEEKRKAEEEAKKAEDKRRAEESRKAAEEARRAAEEKKKADEAKKAEERRKGEERQRALVEAKKVAEEKKKAELEAKKAEEKRSAEERKRAEVEARRAALERRLADADARMNMEAEEERRATFEARWAEMRSAGEDKKVAQEQQTFEDPADDQEADDQEVEDDDLEEEEYLEGEEGELSHARMRAVQIICAARGLAGATGQQARRRRRKIKDMVFKLDLDSLLLKLDEYLLDPDEDLESSDSRLAYKDGATGGASLDDGIHVKEMRRAMADWVPDGRHPQDYDHMLPVRQGDIVRVAWIQSPQEGGYWAFAGRVHREDGVELEAGYVPISILEKCDASEAPEVLRLDPVYLTQNPPSDCEEPSEAAGDAAASGPGADCRPPAWGSEEDVEQEAFWRDDVRALSARG